MEQNNHFSLCLCCELAEGWLTHLNNSSRYYEDNKDKIILAELHKMWKHYVVYLKEICTRKDDYTPSKPKNNTKCEIGWTVMVKIMSIELVDLNTSWIIEY